MKTLVAIRGTGGIGKSSVCKETAIQLMRQFKVKKSQILETYPVGNWLSKKDFRVVFKLPKGTVVAVETKGDPGTELGNRLKEIIKNHKPDIIICTCRSSGETIQAIETLTKYDKIYTSPYGYWETGNNRDATRTNLNELKGAEIIELLKVFNRLEPE